MENNREKVIANDNDIIRQVPGITTIIEKLEIPNQNLDQELYYRAINR
jgi:hypothetical protein